MTQQQDTRGQLRAAYTNRGLKSAKYSFPIGNIGVFMQVTMAVIYMYLILISYTLMGIIGVVFVSILFLVALFSPVFYAVGKELLSKRREFKLESHQVPEAERKG